MTNEVTITHAHQGDAGWVAELIAAAFHPLAVACWLVPDPAQRRPALAGQFQILVEHALTHGQVHTTIDRDAVAVWFPRDGKPIPEPPDYQQRLAAACGDATPRFQHLDELFDQHHPDWPHHHLAFLAVHPHRQRHGLGSALLTHHHTTLDPRGTPAYLEASSPHNRRLYLRHGYHDTPTGPLHLPDGTPLWPMCRPAPPPPAPAGRW